MSELYYERLSSYQDAVTKSTSAQVRVLLVNGQTLEGGSFPIDTLQHVLDDITMMRAEMQEVRLWSRRSNELMIIPASSILAITVAML